MDTWFPIIFKNEILKIPTVYSLDKMYVPYIMPGRQPKRRLLHLYHAPVLAGEWESKHGQWEMVKVKHLLVFL